MFDGNTAGSRHVEIQSFQSPYTATAGAATGIHAVGDNGDLYFFFRTDYDCAATLPNTDLTATRTDTEAASLGPLTQFVDASYDYLIVYEPVP